MADATVLKTVGGNPVRVRVPSPAPLGSQNPPRDRRVLISLQPSLQPNYLFFLFFLLFVILILWKQHVHFRRCVTHRF